MKKFLSLTLALALVLTALVSFSSTALADEPVELVWYISQDAVPTDVDLVFAEMNKYLTEKIGVTVKPYIFRNPDYNEKVPTIVNAGQQFDICFTATWGNLFKPNVEKGAYLALDDLLDQYAPETKALIPDMVWDAARVDGSIYAIPCYKEIGAQPGIMINKDMADELGIDLTAIKTLADMEAALAVVKEKKPDVIGITGLNFNLLAAAQNLTGNQNMPGDVAIPGFDDFASQGDACFNQYDTEEFRSFCEMANRWYNAGYLPSDPVQYASDNGGIYAGGGGFQAISSTSKHPDKALELLNLVNTDKYVGTMLRHGIEGVHYTSVSDNLIDPYGTGYTADNHPYNLTIGWQFGCVFNQKWVNSYPEDVVAQYEAYNAAAVKAPCMGFSFNAEEVSTEQAAISTVIEQYLNPLMTGMVDPATGIAQFNDALKANGVDKLLEELNTQLTSWKAQ
ncbi:MAG: ABC transporter substrate-binding protein [Eubacteriales bacterium]|nr:ABC transporter substrate-binding protein [Eubacteriales bacterium]